MVATEAGFSLQSFALDRFVALKQRRAKEVARQLTVEGKRKRKTRLERLKKRRKNNTGGGEEDDGEEEMLGGGDEDVERGEEEEDMDAEYKGNGRGLQS